MHDDEATARKRVEARLGTVLADKYRLTRVLGVGGMGAVYEAVNTWTERRVAIKLMLAPATPGGDLASRFLREARAAAKLVHPNIVDVLDMGQNPADGALYIVQEFLVGHDLRSLLEQRKALPPREAFEIIAPLMSALVAVHQTRVVHRDLKPENVFLVKTATGQLQPKLIDFGIAKVVEEQRSVLAGLTRTGAAMGTPFYMSPEQARGVKDIDAQTDVWAVGVVLYEMLAGRVPWRSENYNALMVEILAGKCPRLDEVAPGVPREVADVVHRALTLEREQRYATMYDFLVALLDCRAFEQDAWHKTLRDSYRTLPEPAAAAASEPPPEMYRSSGEQATAVLRRGTEPIAPGAGARSLLNTAGTAATVLQPPPPSSPSGPRVTTTNRAAREISRDASAARRKWTRGAGAALAVLVLATGSIAVLSRRARRSDLRGGRGEATLPQPRTVDEMLSQGSYLQTQGRDREAYELFRQAYDASRRPQARAQMGVTAMALGRWVEAVQALHGALASQADPWIQRNRLALDAAHTAALRHVALIDVRSATPGAEVWVNGDRIGTVPLDEPLCLMGGPVTVEVRAPGHRPATRQLTLQAGSAVTEQFDLAPERGAEGAQPAAPRRRAGASRR